MHLYMQHMHMKQKLGQVPNVSSPSKKNTGTHSLIVFGSRSFKNDSICFNMSYAMTGFGHLQHSPACVWSVGNVRFSQLRVKDPSCSQTSSCTESAKHVQIMQDKLWNQTKLRDVFLNEFSSEITSYSHYVMTCHTALCICVLQWLSWTDSLHGHAWSLCAFGCGCALWRGLSTL